jgi:hypothetical protein
LAIDLSIMGKILLSDFEGLNSKKFKLAVIYSLMNGKPCKIFKLNDKVLKLFENKKAHLAFFKLRVDEAINDLIAKRVLLRFGDAYSSLKLSEDYRDTFNELSKNADSEDNMETKPEKSINLVDSFAKGKADYLPQDKISNPDEIIWLLKSVLMNIRQRAGHSCKDCSYFGYLAEFCLESIDPAQLNSHVDYDDQSFQRLALKLKELQNKAGLEAI